MNILRGLIDHYMNAIQRILELTDCEHAVSSSMPNRIPGNFTFFQRLLRKNRPDTTIHKLTDYPHNWTYINIEYQVHGDTVYLLTLNYNIAD